MDEDKNNQYDCEKVSINMSAFEWHILINILNDQLNICNIDNHNTIVILNKIASQFHGSPLDFSPPIKKKMENKPIQVKKGFWARLFS